MADIFSGMQLVEQFSGLFSVLLVFVFTFAILEYTKALGENKFIHAIGAFLFAGIFAFSRPAQGIIAYITPWFVVMFLFILFIIITFMIFGATKGDVTSMLMAKQNRYITWIIITTSVIIIAFGFSSVYGQGLLSMQTPGSVQPTQITTVVNGTTYITSAGTTTAGTDFKSNLYSSLFHPKILGFALIILISVFTIKFMVNPE